MSSSPASILVTPNFLTRVEGGGLQGFTKRGEGCALLFQGCRTFVLICPMRSQVVVKFQCFLEDLLLLLLIISVLVAFQQEVLEKGV